MGDASKNTSKAEAARKPEEFEYLEFLQEPKEGWMVQQGFKAKFIRKTKENPFVPVGLLLTIGALSYGLWQLKTGDTAMSQKMMRLRVAAQGFTVLALLGGVAYQSFSKKPKTQP